MYSRSLVKKNKKTNKKIKGCITSANDHNVIVKVSEEVPYQKGQRISVSIPYKRVTALGRSVEVSEVVAHGTIVDVSKNAVTIKSNRTNPIISKSALRESEGAERVLFVENVE